MFAPTHFRCNHLFTLLLTDTPAGSEANVLLAFVQSRAVAVVLLPVGEKSLSRKCV